MGAKGLNQAQRARVRGMVDSRQSQEEVCKLIVRESQHRDDDWDWDANVQMVRELSRNGYNETARILERSINDNLGGGDYNKYGR